MKTIFTCLIATGLLIAPGLVVNATPPTAHDITMSPIVQSSNLLPLSATAVNTEIVMFTIETVPAETAGDLFLSVNGNTIAITAGMMLSSDLAGSLMFKPNQSFNGIAAFTFSATDANMEVSNTANYSIPVIAHPSAILPVSLLAFNGQLAEHTAHLNWQTAHEQAGCYFELQRSFNGKDFHTIARVSGQGGAGSQEYSSQDNLYFCPAQVIYYRLKMVEVNRQEKYSALVVLTKNKNAGGPKVWPIPFSGQLQVSFQGIQNERVVLQLVSINGATVKRFSMTATQGTNLCQLNELNHLPAGQYILLIQTSNGVTRLQVTK